MEPQPPAIPDWSLSVVSHGHLDSVRGLLEDSRRHLDPSRYELIVTLNIDEPHGDLAQLWPGQLRVIRNLRPRGFGANHNAALRAASGRCVAAIDPDLRLRGNPFPALSAALASPGTGIVSTRVIDEHDAAADNARPVPTLRRLLGRRLGDRAGLYPLDLDRQIAVDWVAGLFMAMRADTFQHLGGFDERFFLYCEDVDLCLRCWNSGLSVQVIPAAVVVHPARRRSLRTWQHFRWHCLSLARLWTSDAYRQFQRAGRRQTGPISDTSSNTSSTRSTDRTDE